MSYLRYGSIFIFVDGTSKDYVWSGGEDITDYGFITDEALIELAFRFVVKRYYADDEVFIAYLTARFKERDVEIAELIDKFVLSTDQNGYEQKIVTALTNYANDVQVAMRPRPLTDAEKTELFKEQLRRELEVERNKW